jgi:hypothetical protein
MSKDQAPEANSSWPSTLDPQPSTKVGPTGVEPARPCGHKALNLARLPIPPRARFTKFTRQKPSLQGRRIAAEGLPKIEFLPPSERATFLWNDLCCRTTAAWSKIIE